MIFDKNIKKWKEKKTSSKISDIVFILLLIALAIPPSRTALIVSVKRVFAFSPGSIESAERESVLSDDYFWALTDLDGNSANLTDFKGKTIFINEWATWCPPCIAEMPSIQKLYDQLKGDESIVFLLISNEKEAVVQKFIRKNQYTFPVYIARSNTPESFYSPSIPTTYLVSPNGEIVLKEVGSKKWHGDKTIELIKSLGGPGGR